MGGWGRWGKGMVCDGASGRSNCDGLESRRGGRQEGRRWEGVQKEEEEGEEEMGKGEEGKRDGPGHEPSLADQLYTTTQQAHT